tara:strand:+ start:405 stop:548 length:144 start_codon:yes stop_codon:yes gene_type:complete
MEFSANCQGNIRDKKLNFLPMNIRLKSKNCIKKSFLSKNNLKTHKLL